MVLLVATSEPHGGVEIGKDVALGHCNVPQGWSENPELGTWVGTQRTRAKKGIMTDEQRRRLEEIGFRF